MAICVASVLLLVVMTCTLPSAAPTYTLLLSMVEAPVKVAAPILMLLTVPVAGS